MTIDPKSIRELCERATRGPWKPEDDDHTSGMIRGPHDEHIAAVSMIEDFGCIDEDSENYNEVEATCFANAAFIAAARTLVPELLDEAERLHDALIVSQGSESKARNERDDLRREYKDFAPRKRYRCLSCGLFVLRYSEFEEFQHAKCGGLVVDVEEAIRLMALRENERDQARTALAQAERERDSYANSEFERQLDEARTGAAKLRALLVEACEIAARIDEEAETGACAVCNGSVIERDHAKSGCVGTARRLATIRAELEKL